jgi:protein-S-isoprenylcysteine O-methyltransferase Ste14
MQFFGPAAIAFTFGQIGVQVARAFFEERILCDTFPEYRAYQARTWRFIPYVI